MNLGFSLKTELVTMFRCPDYSSFLLVDNGIALMRTACVKALTRAIHIRNSSTQLHALHLNVVDNFAECDMMECLVCCYSFNGNLQNNLRKYESRYAMVGKDNMRHRPKKNDPKQRVW